MCGVIVGRSLGLAVLLSYPPVCRYTCAQCDADRATCTDGYACGAQKCDPVPK